MRFHPIASLLPEMTPEAFADLKADIKKVGLRVPLLLVDGAIADGRTRWRAINELSIEFPNANYQCKFVDFDPAIHGESLVDYVMSLNVRRRHLTPSQLAAIAVEIVPLYEAEGMLRKQAGTKPPPGGLVGTSAKQAAKTTGASERSTERAKAVKDADPELHAKVKAGRITVRAAEEQIKAQKSAPSEPASVTDGLGRTVTDPAFVAAWAEAEGIRKQVSACHAVNKAVRQLAESGIGREIPLQEVEGFVKQAAGALRKSLIYTQCPYGDTCKKACKSCRGSGWVNELVYTATPKEIREAFEKS